MWKDLTVDYLTGLLHVDKHRYIERPVCAILTSSLNWLGVVRCSITELSNPPHEFICQYPDARRGQNTEPAAPSPSLAKINVTTVGHNRTKWTPVICRSGHVTHTFLACDVATFCWTEDKVSFSLRPDSWALPTSQSCPAKLTSLPPSFLCQSEKQHVPYTLVCDHRPHCVDGSDEKFCKYPSCLWEFQFECLSKQVCIECSCVYATSMQKQDFTLVSDFTSRH